MQLKENIIAPDIDESRLNGVGYKPSIEGALNINTMNESDYQYARKVIAEWELFFKNKTIPDIEKYHCISQHVNGYVTVTIGTRKFKNFHIMVMENHIKRIVKKSENVHHINGIKSDNRLCNLLLMGAKEHISYHRLKEQKEGTKDRTHSFYIRYGEESTKAKLTGNQVLEIYSSSLSMVELGHIYKVKASTVRCIKNGSSWWYLTGAKRKYKKYYNHAK
jgi:hypothetical protein